MNSTTFTEVARLAGLPGGELILQGLSDARAGLETTDALLVEIAAPRLRQAGLAVPEFGPQPIDAEIRLYRLLGRQFGRDAYGQYNSMLRRLSSLSRALEGAANRSAGRSAA
jgi:hypothetical protein